MLFFGINLYKKGFSLRIFSASASITKGFLKVENTFCKSSLCEKCFPIPGPIPITSNSSKFFIPSIKVFPDVLHIASGTEV